MQKQQVKTKKNKQLQIKEELERLRPEVERIFREQVIDIPGGFDFNKEYPEWAEVIRHAKN